MIFQECTLKGAYLVKPEKLEDSRGFFARIFCENEFKANGLDFAVVQCNISYNMKKGTLRGMHFQVSPYEESKIVSCMRGAIFDVIVDLRRESKTYLQWEGYYLNEENRNMLFVPKGFAHGFQTLEDDTEVLYLMSEFYSAEHASGIRWDNPQIKIDWPSCENRIISSKDMEWSNHKLCKKC